mmetsp:Transcript_9006/g.27318  ORF Transcript_9006/g.27318 Transcript_9006/m.27318 type:complete len:334 (-) Transcript_9006:99-1100(-)
MIAVGQDPDVLAGLEALETDRALALNEGQGGVERERVSEKEKKTGTLGVGSRLQDGLTFISAAHLKGTFLSCPGVRPAGLWPLPSTSTETPVLAVPSASLVGYEYLAPCPAALVTLSRASGGSLSSLRAFSRPESTVKAVPQWKRLICRPPSLDRNPSAAGGSPPVSAEDPSSRSASPGSRAARWPGGPPSPSKRNCDVSRASTETMAPASAPKPIALKIPPREGWAATAPATAPAKDPTSAKTPRSAPFSTGFRRHGMTAKSVTPWRTPGCSSVSWLPPQNEQSLPSLPRPHSEQASASLWLWYVHLSQAQEISAESSAALTSTTAGVDGAG